MGRNNLICGQCGRNIKRKTAPALCWVCRRAIEPRRRTAESWGAEKATNRRRRRADMAVFHVARQAADLPNHPGVLTRERLDYLAARAAARLPLFDGAPSWVDRNGMRHPGNLRDNNE